jgi:phosphate transport system permease protein
MASTPWPEFFPRLRPPSRWAERAFHLLTVAMACSLPVLICLLGWEMWRGSELSREKFGLAFLFSSAWDPALDDYGAVPFIFGTMVSSIIALLLAVPLSLGSAIYLTELAPRWVRQPLASLIEMLAAVPSVILGLWGFYVLVPFLHESVYPALENTLGRHWALFAGPDYGVSMLAGGMIIAVMILPIITSVSREILRSVPQVQREAAYALGATRWEAIRMAVLSQARPGLCGAVILGLGRALGETMAVTMVIGNRPEIAKSLLAPGYTLASVIANEFTEATSDVFLSALLEIGLVLFGVTVVVNLLAQLLLRGFARPPRSRFA